MVTSTFGKSTPFHPTPSTCYPPPPPPPLPYDVPCLKGPTTLPLRHRGWIRIQKTVFPTNLQIQIPTNGIPTAGSAGADKTWTLNLSSAQLIWAKLQLICHKINPILHLWKLTIDGVAITPDGTFCSFTRLTPALAPADASVPDRFNDIRSQENLLGSDGGAWHASTYHSQWYTTGAPPMPPI